MDTLAHSLWSVAIGRSATHRVAWWKLALAGAGPDLVWLPFTFVQLVTSGRIYFFQGPYNISHSVIVWAIGTLLLTLRWRRAFFWTWPWAFHILVDIPGHQSMLTPIFWPVASYKVPGWFDWLSWPYFLGTYVALGFVYFFFRRRIFSPKSLVSRQKSGIL